MTNLNRFPEIFAEVRKFSPPAKIDSKIIKFVNFGLLFRLDNIEMGS